MCNFIFLLVPIIQSPDSDDTTIIYIAIAIICVLVIAVTVSLLVFLKLVQNNFRL